MIDRIKKTKDYTVIANFAANDPRLSLKAKGLFFYLMTKPDDWQVSRDGVASQVKEGKDAVAAALKELEDAGYLTRDRLVKDAQGRFRPEAVLHEKPQQPTAGKPMAGNPPTENTTQVNTNIVNTDEVNTTSSKELVRPDKRDPSIQQVIDEFETLFEAKLTKPHLQRFAAKRLVGRYGVETVLAAVRLAKTYLGQPFKPQVKNILDLEEKWVSLRGAYQRAQEEAEITKEIVF